MSRLFVGIDIGKYHHEVLVVSAEGKVLRHFRMENTQESVDRLWGAVTDVGAGGHGSLRVGSVRGSTGHGARVKVINPIQSDSLHNLGFGSVGSDLMPPHLPHGFGQGFRTIDHHE